MSESCLNQPESHAQQPVAHTITNISPDDKKFKPISVRTALRLMARMRLIFALSAMQGHHVAEVGGLLVQLSKDAEYGAMRPVASQWTWLN